MNTKEITYEQFEKKYRPIKNKFVEEAPYNGCFFETYGEDIDFIQSVKEDNKIWTLIDSDNENSYIVAGFHYINRVGYFVTEIPWEKEFIEINLNEMISVSECLDYGEKFIQTTEYSSIFNRLDFLDYISLEYDITDKMSIGDAKYLTIEYMEDAFNIDFFTTEYEETIHDFYSNLI